MIRSTILAVILTLLVMAAQKYPGVIPDAAREAGSAIAEHATKALKDAGEDLPKAVTGALAAKTPATSNTNAPAAPRVLEKTEAPATALQPLDQSAVAGLAARANAAPAQDTVAVSEATIQASLREAARLLSEMELPR